MHTYLIMGGIIIAICLIMIVIYYCLKLICNLKYVTFLPRFLGNNITGLRYGRALDTGLGDRLGVLLGLDTMGKIFNRSVYYTWTNEKNGRKDRYYSFDNIQKNIIWPNNLKVENKKNTSTTLRTLIHDKGGEFPCTDAYDCIPKLIPKTFDNIDFNISTTFFQKKYFETVSQFDITIGKLPTVPYITIHIRGGDKKYLDDVKSTQNIINIVQYQLNIPVIIVNNDQSLLHNFTIFNKLDFPTKNLNKEEKDLYDMRILMNSIGIIQYSPRAWSAFSNIASLIRKVPLLSTYKGKDNRILDFNSKGGNVDFWYTFDHLNEFINTIKNKKTTQDLQ